MDINALRGKIEKTLTPYFDAISLKVNTLIDRTGVKASEIVKDDEAMQRIFRTAHESLPFFVRVGVKVDNFVDFCMRHRERFVRRDPGGDERSPAKTTEDAAPLPNRDAPERDGRD